MTLKGAARRLYILINQKLSSSLIKYFGWAQDDGDLPAARQVYIVRMENVINMCEL
jgi:hypothetical protein